MSDILSVNEKWKMVHADSIEHMATMPRHSVDFSIFSPPFPSLFAYTSQEADLGNSEDLQGEAKLHFAFFFRQLVRIIKPGRAVIVHCMQIPALARQSQRSTFDFRGLLIRLAQRAGFEYQIDWPVTKNPQAQAIRTHSHKLLFVTMERDSAKSAPSFQDYLIKFLAPGENAEPILPSITREEWIEWAEGVWDWRTIRETDTLNVRGTKGNDDTKHICPLQLPVIRRCVRLWTNPDEIVFSPFGGIGSEGFEALKQGRRYYGVELKREYFETAKRNLAKAVTERKESMALFPDED